MHFTVEDNLVLETGHWRRREKGHLVNLKLHSTVGRGSCLELLEPHEAGQMHSGQAHNKKQGGDSPTTVLTGTDEASLE